MTDPTLAPGALPLPDTAVAPEPAPPAGKHDADIDRLFSAGGPLAPAVGSFSPRRSQTEMAKSIAEAIAGQ